MSITSAQFRSATAGVGDSTSVSAVVAAINTGGGIDPATLTANSVMYAVTNATPAALSVGVSRIVGRKASGNIAAMTGAETVALLSPATNSANGVATAAQITALEAATTSVGTLKAGIGAAPDSPATGALSLTTATSFLVPAGDTTFSLAAGTLGQHKWAVMGASHIVTITNVSGWTGTAAGDYVHACYTGGGWIALDSRATP